MEFIPFIPSSADSDPKPIIVVSKRYPKSLKDLIVLQFTEVKNHTKKVFLDRQSKNIFQSVPLCFGNALHLLIL